MVGRFEAGGTGLRAGSGRGLKLVAVEYVVPGAGSNPPGVSEPPTVLGQEDRSSSRPWAGTPALLGLEHEPGRDVTTGREVNCT